MGIGIKKGNSGGNEKLWGFYGCSSVDDCDCDDGG